MTFLDVPYEAKMALLRHINGWVVTPGVDLSNLRFSLEDIFVIWSSKILGNWKAILGVRGLDYMMYEVTHNGQKNETYIDIYKKHGNVLLKTND